MYRVRLESGQIKTNCKTSQIVTVFWKGGLGELQNHFPLSVATRLLVFIATILMRLLVFQATTELGRVEWSETKLKCHYTHHSYHDLAIFLE